MALSNLRMIACALGLLGAFVAGWGAQGWRKGAQLQEQRTQHAKKLQGTVCRKNRHCPHCSAEVRAPDGHPSGRD